MPFKVATYLNRQVTTVVEDNPNRLAIVIPNDISTILAITGFSVGVNIVAAGAIDKALLDASYRFFCARETNASLIQDTTLFGGGTIPNIEFEYKETLRARIGTFPQYFTYPVKLIEPTTYTFALDFIFNAAGITGFIGTVISLIVYGELLQKNQIENPYQYR